jgi:hypothetical protein
MLGAIAGDIIGSVHEYSGMRRGHAGEPRGLGLRHAR